MSGFSPSPGLTVVFCAVGFFFIIFAIWAVYKFILPYLREPHGKPFSSLPQVEQRRPIHPTLRQSLYSQHNLLNVTDPRNTLQDYDLKNSRFSTNIVELNKSRPGSASRSRSRPGSSHDRSRSRTRDLSALRSSLYSEPGLLSNDARSSYLNLVLDQPDVVSQAPTPRPRSLYAAVPGDNGSIKSGISKRDLRNSVPELIHLRNSLFSENTLYTAPNSANASVTDLIASKGYFDGRHDSFITSANVGVTGYGFRTSSRHSLPGSPGIGAMTPTSAYGQRKSSVPSSGMTTPGPETPGHHAGVKGADVRQRLLEAVDGQRGVLASPEDLPDSKIGGGGRQLPLTGSPRPRSLGPGKKQGGRDSLNADTSGSTGPAFVVDEKMARARFDAERARRRRSTDAAATDSQRRARSVTPRRHRERSRGGSGEYTAEAVIIASTAAPTSIVWNPKAPAPYAPQSNKGLPQATSQRVIPPKVEKQPDPREPTLPQVEKQPDLREPTLPQVEKQPDTREPTLPNVSLPNISRKRSATPSSPSTPGAGSALLPKDNNDRMPSPEEQQALIRERSFDRFSTEAKIDGDGDGDGEWPLKSPTTPVPSVPIIPSSFHYIRGGNASGIAGEGERSVMMDREKMVKAWRHHSVPTTPYASPPHTSSSPVNAATGAPIDYLSHLNIQSPPATRSPSETSRNSASMSPPPRFEPRDIPTLILPSNAMGRGRQLQRMTMPVSGSGIESGSGMPSVRVVRASLDDEERGRSPPSRGRDGDVIVKRKPFIERGWLARRVS